MAIETLMADSADNRIASVAGDAVVNYWVGRGRSIGKRFRIRNSSWNGRGRR